MVRGQDYSRGWARPESVFRVTHEVERPYRRARLALGDLVVTIVGAGTGNVAVVPSWLAGANITQTTARVAPNLHRVAAGFLAAVLESWIGQVQVSLHVKGAAQPGLNLGHLSKFRIPLPTRGEQDEIFGAITAGCGHIHSLRSRITHAISLLREYRSALISAAVTGQIDIPSEEDAA